MHKTHNALEYSMIEAFIAVVDHGSTNAAAAEVGITQPALSRRIKGLEAAVGHPLFLRNATGLALNALGAEFLPVARSLQLQFGTASRFIRGRAGSGMRFTVACPSIVGSAFLAPFIASGEQGVSDVIEAPTRAVHDHLVRNRADIAIVPMAPADGYASRALFAVPLLVHCAPGSRHHGRATIDVAELADEEAFTSNRETVVFERLASIVSGMPRPPRLREASSGPMAQAMAAGSGGIALGVEPPGFGLTAALLTAEGHDIEITEWASWHAGHHGEAEIHALLDRFVAWATAESSMHRLLRPLPRAQ
ncbi:LysR family transcriptional regulator [Leucobacter allii]|uniref:LysR family transcriptional regulator n=1 Tax=Leucobacter allii TaxID=2932247 RepID=A0ABY4FKN2_9MICO|nr:LysR family transcriptional regulator [Leucobacter allii]UOQ56816.1 LysR family transcriptional regulator [Leucobacter allii]